MILQPILLSVKVALMATCLTFIIGMICAYVMSKTKIKFKTLWETVIMLPLILPPSVLGYILLTVIGKRGFVGALFLKYFDFQIVFTWVACVIAATIASLPLMYQSIKSSLVNIDPIYEDAARDLGANKLRVFMKVTLPLSLPGIISGLILTFARSMGEFGATLMIAGNIPGKTQTISTAIYFAVDGGNDGQAKILVLIMTIMSFTVVFGLNFWLKRGRK
ncbi:MAG: molybdate ABC transporter permease subunit [Aminipila sp.]